MIHIIMLWRDADPDQWRTPAREYVTEWWRRTHPDAAVTVGASPRGRPWMKGVALRRGLAASGASGQDVCVVTDADVICESSHVNRAIMAVTSGERGWAVPHRMVRRLTSEATTLLYRGRTLGSLDTGRRSPHVHKQHLGVAGGGLVVTTAAVLRVVPIDPRYLGWGQEDYSWGRALTMTQGHPYRGHGILTHLYHPHGKTGQPRAEQDANHALWLRYRSAATVDQMMTLLGEANADADAKTRPSGSETLDAAIL